MSTQSNRLEAPHQNQQQRQFTENSSGNEIVSNIHTPTLPPLPRGYPSSMTTGFGNSYIPFSNTHQYSAYSGGGGIGPYGTGYGGLSYRNPLYGNSLYGTNGSIGGFGGGDIYGNYGVGNLDVEQRFVQYAEQKTQSIFADVENIVRAVNSISLMLDSTFFAITNSFRAVLNVAENFGRLRSMFGQIWYSISLFRALNWLYSRLLRLLGIESTSKRAWKEAKSSANELISNHSNPRRSSNWSTLGFLTMLVSAPYIISKFLPKFEDKCDPVNWKSPGVRAKAAFNLQGRNAQELSVHVNDVVIIAPASVQEEMNLKNTGWAYAVSNGNKGLIPINYLIINKNNDTSNRTNETDEKNINNKGNGKKVSFGKNQIFETVVEKDE